MEDFDKIVEEMKENIKIRTAFQPVILEKPSNFTIEQRINILEHKIEYWNNRKARSETKEETEKYDNYLKKISHYYYKLKTGYNSKVLN